MKSPKAKIRTSTNRIWLKRLLLTLVILIIVPLTLFTIGWFNRDRIIEVLQDRYSESTTGTLSIGKVNASFLRGFPNVGFTLKDITHTNNDTITDQMSTLHIEEAKLVIGAGKLLRRDFAFKKIEISNAIYSSEVVSRKPRAYYEQLKLNKSHTTNDGFKLPDWLQKKGARLILNNVQYISQDSILNKYFNLDIHQLSTRYRGDAHTLQGESWLDMTVHALGFNTDKGNYFNGANVTGSPQYHINLKDNYIEVSDFPLHINDQTFQLQAAFDLSEVPEYVFQLENAHTDFTAVKELLNDRIAAKLGDYEIKNPFESYLKIAGKFQYGNNPDIIAEFSTENNDLLIADRFNLKNASFKGKLTTDIYDTDSLKSAKKSPKDFKLFFDHLSADIEHITVDIRDSYFQSTPENLNYFDTNIQLHGKNEALAALIETDNFDFKGGTFHFDAHIEGDIPSPYQFLNVSTGEFKLMDTHVILKKNGLQLPVQSLAVTLENENAILNELIVNLSNGEYLVLNGELTHLSGLLAPEPQLPTTSRISLHSDHLNVNEVISMAKEFVPKTNLPVDERKQLHETLDAIYRQFHPVFQLRIGALTYNEVVIQNVKSKIELRNPESLLLHYFDFDYHQAQTHLKGNIKVYGPESSFSNAVYLDAEARSEGPISVFKDLFHIELFDIQSGDYKFSGNIHGQVNQFEKLLNNVHGDLSLTHTLLQYPPTDTDITIDSLSLKVDNSNILLNHFKLQFDELHPLHLSGAITEFPSFLLDNSPESGAVNLKVAAPYFDGDTLLHTIQSFENDQGTPPQKNKKALHRVFKDLYRFHPEVELAIDSLKFRELITEQIDAQMYFENDSILKLDHLNLNFKNTSARVHGTVNAHSSEDDLQINNPFDLDFYVKVKGNSEDLNDYLKTKNFLFKSGHFDFRGNYKAQAQDLSLLNPEGFGDLKIGGTVVDYQAANLQIPVDSLHLHINNDVAVLKTLDIQLPGKSKIYFSGTIDHFSEFIDNSDNQSRHSSRFSIYAPYLDILNVQQFLLKSTIGAGDNDKFDFETWKQAMQNINTSFNPSLKIQVDTLKHDQISVIDFGSTLSFDTQQNFQLDDLALKFHQGAVKINASVGIDTEHKTPVTIDMNLDHLDLNKLLTRVDFFDNEDLRRADSIRGTLTSQIKAEGMLDVDGKLDMNSVNGTLHIYLEDLALYNYEPVMDNVPLLRSERFKNLRFQPIVQTLNIINGKILIPQTEIQSSALQLFVEGQIKLDHYLNVWLSVPWKNLKQKDGITLPEKTNYKGAGAKFFLQFIQDKDRVKLRKQKLKVKFRLGNRKLRKMRKTLKE